MNDCVDASHRSCNRARITDVANHQLDLLQNRISRLFTMYLIDQIVEHTDSVTSYK